MSTPQQRDKRGSNKREKDVGTNNNKGDVQKTPQSQRQQKPKSSEASTPSTQPTTAPMTQAEEANRQMYERTLYMTMNLVGRVVQVQVKSGATYEGIFHTAQTEKGFGVVLKMARKRELGSTALGPVSATIIIQPKDFVQIVAKDVTFDESDGSLDDAFMTDTDISGHKDMGERELQPWVPDSDFSSNLSLTSSGNANWDQFAVNAKLFGVKTTYEEEIYTTKLDRSSHHYQEQSRMAQRIADEIEGKVSSNVHLAEERGQIGVDDMDEEEKYSSVIRSGGSGGSGGSGVYVPPGKRNQQQQQAHAGENNQDLRASSEVDESAKDKASNASLKSRKTLTNDTHRTSPTPTSDPKSTSTLTGDAKPVDGAAAASTPAASATTQPTPSSTTTPSASSTSTTTPTTSTPSTSTSAASTSSASASASSTASSSLSSSTGSTSSSTITLRPLSKLNPNAKAFTPMSANAPVFTPKSFVPTPAPAPVMPPPPADHGTVFFHPPPMQPHPLSHHPGAPPHHLQHPAPPSDPRPLSEIYCEGMKRKNHQEKAENTQPYWFGTRGSYRTNVEDMDPALHRPPTSPFPPNGPPSISPMGVMHAIPVGPPPHPLQPSPISMGHNFPPPPYVNVIPNTPMGMGMMGPPPVPIAVGGPPQPPVVGGPIFMGQPGMRPYPPHPGVHPQSAPIGMGGQPPYGYPPQMNHPAAPLSPPHQPRPQSPSSSPQSTAPQSPQPQHGPHTHTPHSHAHMYAPPQHFSSPPPHPQQPPQHTSSPVPSPSHSHSQSASPASPATTPAKRAAFFSPTQPQSPTQTHQGKPGYSPQQQPRT